MPQLGDPDLIPPLSYTRGPLTIQSFFYYLLPPILCYYATAVLVLLPDTRFFRLALLPFTLWTILRSVIRLDLVVIFNDERLSYWNQGLVLILSLFGMRAIIWSFQRKPCRRVGAATEGDVQTLNNSQVTMDALNLFSNFRGHGWTWSAGVKIPPETRPTSSTSAFISSTTTSFILHWAMFDLLHYCVQWFSPLTIGSAVGGTIFDLSMPPAQRYLRSSTITLLSGLAIISALQAGYHFCTLLGVLVFRQHISLWPPLFRDPWFATSVTNLWSDRWHQLFREVFVSLGGRPMERLLGRIGFVFGTFFLSGLLHHVGLWAMGNGSDFRKVVGCFMMMGTGTIMEAIFRMITGRRVSGFFGWLWTWLWVLGWAHLLVEAWATHGLMGSVFFPRSFRPAFCIFGPLPFHATGP